MKIKLTEKQLFYLIKEEFKENIQPTFVVYLMVGLPGSGKSTWCKNHIPNVPIISRDIIRAELGYTKSSEEKAVLSKEQEQKVTDVEYSRIEDFCRKKIDFAIDDTNIGRFRKGLIDNLRKFGAYIIGVNLQTPLETCIERRKNDIPPQAMEKIYQRMISLDPNEVDKVINI